MFLSYSHALDGKLAPALQAGLERFAKPWYRPRALRVFRDSASLSANPGLWSSIEQALASSSWLALMASPEAARSPWVDREVKWWVENKSPQHVLVVLTEGEFVWPEGSGHLDPTKAALPPSLHGVFAEESRWVDLRWLHNADHVDLSNPRLRECVADLAAAVRDVPKDALVGEHIVQHRRTMRLARSAVTTLAVLLIAATVAVAQRNQAIRAQHLAIARGMVAQADRIRAQDPFGALRLGAAADSFDASPQTQASLEETLASTWHSRTVHANGVNGLAYSPDGRTLATGSSDQTAPIILWDLSDREEPRPLGKPLIGHTNSILSVALAPILEHWPVPALTRPYGCGMSPTASDPPHSANRSPATPVQSPAWRSPPTGAH